MYLCHREYNGDLRDMGGGGEVVKETVSEEATYLLLKERKGGC